MGAPINFVCAISFIQFYRKYIIKTSNNDKGNDNGNDGGRNDDNGHENKNEQIINNKMKMTAILYSMKRHWLGIPPSTICLKIEIDNEKMHEVFETATVCA